MDPSPERILIFGADASSRAILEDLLRRSGYQVSSSDSSQGVLESARSGVVDLLVLEAGAPGIDSGHLLSKLRDGPMAEGLRILVLETGRLS